MSRFRLHTKREERNYRNYVLIGIAGILAVLAGIYAVHSIGTAGAKSRETVLLHTEEEFEQYLLYQDSEDYNLNGRYRLEEDLDLSWLYQSVGTNVEPFTGSFDGNGHVISGLGRPLFGVLRDAKVENLYLSDAVIENPFTYYDGEHYVDGYGALAAYAVNSRIINCGMNGEIRTASPSEAEYLLEKASPSDADEEKGPGIQGPGGAMDGVAGGDKESASQEVGPGVETTERSGEDAGPGIENETGTGAESVNVTESESGSGVEDTSQPAGEETSPQNESDGNGPADTEGAEAVRPSETPQETSQESSWESETGSSGNPPADATDGESGQAGGTEGAGAGETAVEERNTEPADTKPTDAGAADTKPEDTRPADTGSADTQPTQSVIPDSQLVQSDFVHIDIASAETVGYRPVERQLLAKTSLLVDTDLAGPSGATPSDAEETTGQEGPGFTDQSPTEKESPIATPSDADSVETGSENHKEPQPEEEPQYIGNPNGDIIILVTAERVTAGGLVAQTAGETLLSNSFALITIGSFLEEPESYTGGLCGILGEGTRTENSYVSGLSDSDGVNGGFAAVNDGHIENCYSTVTLGESGTDRGAFTRLGSGTLIGCAYDRQMACIEADEMENEAETDDDASPSDVSEFELRGLWTSDMAGAESVIPGDWRKKEHAYPQLEYFAQSEHETIMSNSKLSVVALELPEGLSLADVLNAGGILLPMEVDGQEIQWDGEGGIEIGEDNQLHFQEQVTFTPNDTPTVGTSLESEPGETLEVKEISEAEQESDIDSDINTNMNSDTDLEPESSVDNSGLDVETGSSKSSIRLNASIGVGSRSYALTVAQERAVPADWSVVGNTITTPPPTANSSGTPGTEANPYLLDSPEDLAWFAVTVNAGDVSLCATMTTDIDLFGGDYTNAVYNPNDLSNSLLWISIAAGYNGVFDGGNHKIKNLRLSGSGSSCGFVSVMDGGTIKNLGIESGYVNFSGQRRAGVFMRKISSGKIINCWNGVDLSRGQGETGGIVGYVSGGGEILIEGCYNLGNISGNAQYDCGVGGILGTVWSFDPGGKLTIRNCYNAGTITATDNYSAAGIIGKIISNSESYADLKIENCYNVGLIKSNGRKAISGSSNQDRIINCYYDSETSGSTDSKATAFTTKQMQSWVAAYKLNGSSMTGAWQYNKGGYPTFGNLVPFDWEKAGEALECGFLPSDKTKPAGSGTSDSPYQIKDAEQLAWLAYLVNSGTKPDACATLLNNIDLTGTAYTGTSGAPLPWIPISNYSGAFGVKNTEIYELSGLHIGTTASSVNAGLFDTVSGTVARTAVVKSTLTSSGGKQGAITGVLNGGTIYQCYSRENVGSGASYAGGIAGQMTGAVSEIRDCYTLKPRLSASGSGSAAGGIAGDGSSGKIQNCYNALLSGGTITAGGRAGSIAGTGNLVRCYSDTSLSDSSQVTRFDTTADAKRQEQTAELNNYGGSARVGADRVWYTSLNSESTAGYPTLEAPKIVSVEFVSDTPEGGSTVNLKDSLSNSLSIPDMKLRSFGSSDSNFTPGSTGTAGNSFSLSAFADITGANSNYHKYGYTNANTYLGFRAGGTDLKGLASSLASPAASLQTVSSISLGRAAACTKPEDRYVLLEGASGTQRYEIQITVKGVTSKTLSVVMPVKVTMAKLTPDGRAHKDYSLDLKITNKNGYPIDGKILKAVSKSGYTKLTSVLPSISLPSTGNITDASGGVRLALTDVQGASPALVGSRYYDEAGAAAGTAWMEYRLKNGGSLPYRYAMEYNGLHFGTEAQFSYDIHYWFGISKDDYTAAAQAVVP
ncbi:hypothetical protein [Hungatella hathewayi]|nr:hypothetical protein [Hungatella hathewayi]